MHSKVDQWHTQECANLINNLSPQEQKLVYQGTIKGAKLLWQFLDSIPQVNEELVYEGQF